VTVAQGDFQLDADACWAALAPQGRSAQGCGFSNNVFMDDDDDDDCWLEVRRNCATWIVS